MSRWFQEQRDKWLLRQLQMVGFTSLPEIQEKFDIKMLEAVKDISRFEKTYPGMTRWEGKTFRLKVFPWRFPGTDDYFCNDCDGGGAWGFEKCESCQGTKRLSFEQVMDLKSSYGNSEFAKLYQCEWDPTYLSEKEMQRKMRQHAREDAERARIRDLTPRSKVRKIKPFPSTEVKPKGDGIIRGGFSAGKGTL